MITEIRLVTKALIGIPFFLLGGIIAPIFVGIGMPMISILVDGELVSIKDILEVLESIYLDIWDFITLKEIRDYIK